MNFNEWSEIGLCYEGCYALEVAVIQDARYSLYPLEICKQGDRHKPKGSSHHAWSFIVELLEHAQA